MERKAGTIPGGEARLAALGMLAGVLEDGRPLSEAAGPDDPALRARAHRLAGLVLRHMGRADRALRPHLRRVPPAPVMNLLRLAAVEMLSTGAAPHGVVNSAVGLMRADGRMAPFAGLANAVLRRVAETGAADWAAAGPERLPKWLRGRMIAAWGSNAVAAMERAHEAGAPVDLTLRAPGEDWSERLEAEVLPTGSLRRRGGGQISDLPGYAEGAWWVQDAAAALPAQGLGLRAGEAVLDLCAAPGGKTLQMAAAGARVTALDLSPLRLARLEENLARTGLAAEVIAADALGWAPGRAFDAILLDAPCTATGTIRRHPDLPFVRRREDVAALVALQSAMLDRALGWLAPGGRLVFCTCSLLPEEGERQVTAALSRHPGLRVDAGAFDLPGVAPAWRSAEGGLRLRPDAWADRGGIDGFYMACLRRS